MARKKKSGGCKKLTIKLPPTQNRNDAAANELDEPLEFPESPSPTVKRIGHPSKVEWLVSGEGEQLRVDELEDSGVEIDELESDIEKEDIEFTHQSTDRPYMSAAAVGVSRTHFYSKL